MCSPPLLLRASALVKWCERCAVNALGAWPVPIGGRRTVP